MRGWGAWGVVQGSNAVDRTNREVSQKTGVADGAGIPTMGVCAATGGTSKMTWSCAMHKTSCPAVFGQPLCHCLSGAPSVPFRPGSDLDPYDASDPHAPGPVQLARETESVPREPGQGLRPSGEAGHRTRLPISPAPGHEKHGQELPPFGQRGSRAGLELGLGPWTASCHSSGVFGARSWE